MVKTKETARTTGELIGIGWDGVIEIRKKDNTEVGIASLGSHEDGAIPTAKTRENAGRFIALWNAAENLRISTEAVKNGALQKVVKACDEADTAFVVINGKLRMDARIINDRARRVFRSGLNILSTPELKKKYSHIDNHIPDAY